MAGKGARVLNLTLFGLIFGGAMWILGLVAAVGGRRRAWVGAFLVGLGAMVLTAGLGRYFAPEFGAPAMLGSLLFLAALCWAGLLYTSARRVSE